MKAIWNGEVLAETDDTVVVEGNHYFPIESIKQQFFKPGDTTSHCHWKGEASYFSIEVNGDVNTDAAWYYKNPKDAAKQITDRVAFWKGIKITD